MNAIRVIAPGMFTTVQDLGRPGFAAQGVPTGGAADWAAIRLGNALVNNEPGDAALEMTLVGGTFEFEGAGLVALAGPEVDAIVERAGGSSSPTRVWEPITVAAGDRIRVGPMRTGARAYLCVQGGVDVPLLMGSRSTLVACAMGGFEGRLLRAGDRIELGSARDSRVQRSLTAKARRCIESLHAPRTLRIVPGSHADRFPPDAIQAFTATEFTVSSRSDRSGIRLKESIPTLAGTGTLESEGMMCGAIEITPSGEPIILMPDGPVTGGYPVLATVITADHPALAQLRPNTRVRLELVTLDDARHALRELLNTLESSTQPANP